MKKKDLDKVILPSDLENGDESVNTQDNFFIFSTEEVKELPSLLKTVAPSDYAIANQARVDVTNRTANGKPTTIYWTRSYYNRSADQTSLDKKEAKVKVFDSRGNPRIATVNSSYPCVVPAFRISCKELKKLTQGIKNNGFYHSVVLDNLQYPQTKVSASLAEELENFYKFNDPSPSGYYIGTRSNASGEYSTDEKDYEYVYKGRRYVRVVAESSGNGATSTPVFSDGSACENGKVYWFEVEPISWIITNYEQSELCKAAGETEVILRAEDAIIGGVPFYIDSSDLQGALWQNSFIRAMLNGIDIKDSLKKRNGNKDYKAGKNFDFSDPSRKPFCEAFFKDEVVVQKTEAKKDTKVKVNSPFGLRVRDTPMTAEEQIKFYIEHGMSFMLHGPSGVGKTRRVQEADPSYIMITLRNGMLPEEVIGKTIYERDNEVWLPPIWYKELCAICKREPDKFHTLLIDELTNVRPYEQNLVYDIVLEHTVGGTERRLPENCVVVATGNNPLESKSAYTMTEPLFRRFSAHLTFTPNVRSFIEWGGSPNPKHPSRPKIHPAVLAFVGANGLPALYTEYRDAEDKNPTEFAIDPRGWEQVSDILYSGKGEVDFYLLRNKMGEVLATSFLNFIQKQQITVDSIMADRVDKSIIPTSADGKYALVLSLRWADESQVKKVKEFILQNLGREYERIYDSVWIEESDDRALLIDDLNQEDDEEIEEIH